MFKLIVALLLFVSLNANAMIFGTSKVLEAGSMGVDVVSNGVDASQYGLVSFQAVWAGGGSPDGVFTIEVSNDNVQSCTTGNESCNVTNWTTYGSSSIAINSDGDLGYSIYDFAYRWVRVKYTRNSGTGTLNIEAVLKKESYK